MNDAHATNDPVRHPSKVHLTEQPVAVVHELVPMSSLTDFFGRAFGTVMAAAQRQGTGLAGPPFALYRGMPHGTVDVEAGFPITGDFMDSDGVAGRMLPETDALEALHLGPYDTLEKTYEAILAQMEAEGLTPADVMWEYYLSDPEAEPDPAKWQTRVVWPVA